MGFVNWFQCLYRFPFRVEASEKMLLEIKEDLKDMKERVVWKDACKPCKNGLLGMIELVSQSQHKCSDEPEETGESSEIKDDT